MKRYVSAIVVAAMLAGSVNTAFAGSAVAVSDGYDVPFADVEPTELLYIRRDCV